MDETKQPAPDPLVQAIVENGGRMDGACVVSSLDAGLSQLKTLLYQRLHDDLQQLPQDSMYQPVSAASEAGAQELTRRHLELYLAVECEQAARKFGYVASDSDWFLPGLIAHRMGEMADRGLVKQRDRYCASDGDQRRLAFTDALMNAVPESRKTPLVLFRLAPLAVHIAMALSFDDRRRAQELRAAQRAILPSIADCRACRGAVLDNGQACAVCGNPVWTLSWLTVAD